MQLCLAHSLRSLLCYYLCHNDTVIVYHVRSIILMAPICSCMDDRDIDRDIHRRPLIYKVRT